MKKSNKIALCILIPSLILFTLLVIFDEQPIQATSNVTNTNSCSDNNKLIQNSSTGWIYVNAKKWSQLSEQKRESISWWYHMSIYDKDGNIFYKTFIYDYLINKKIEHFIWYL